MKVAVRASITLLLIALCGCETIRRPEELAWQAVHVADVLQTMTIPGDPCLVENDPLTRTLIGRKPSKAGVIAWGVGSAGVHLLVSNALRESGYDGAYRAWQFVSIGAAAYTVGNNHAIGIRIGKPNKVKCL